MTYDDIEDARQRRRSQLISAGHAQWAFRSNETIEQLDAKLLKARFEMDKFLSSRALLVSWHKAQQRLVDAAMARVVPDLMDEYGQQMASILSTFHESTRAQAKRIEDLEAEIYAAREASDEWREKALDALVSAGVARFPIYDSCPLCGSHAHIVKTEDSRWNCVACQTPFDAPVTLIYAGKSIKE